MKTVNIKKLLCFLCLSLLLAPAVVSAGKSETLSVLDRVEMVDDPDLGDLIRAAIQKKKNISEETAFEIIRKVTQSYAQITLYDQQIEQITHKIESTKLAEMQYELMLAKAELESKRTVEMANLRAVMGIIPMLASAKRPIATLNAYISLQLIGNRVYVLDCQKPFSEYWAYRRWKVAGFFSEKETLEYIRGRLKEKESLPITFHIYYDPETEKAAESLRSKIIPIAIETNSQMDAEVRLEQITWTGNGTSTFFVREGTIRTLHAGATIKRPDGGSKPIVSGIVDSIDVEQHIIWRLTKEKNVPLTFLIEYDEQSASLAKQIADTAKAVIKRLGITELADVTGTLVEPVPESAFMGRWQTTGKGDIQTIDVQADGVCQATKGEGMGSIRTGTSVSGTWFVTTKEIIVDINNKSPYGPDYIYQGYLDEEGNLVIARGIIYPQGTFYESGPSPRTILRKVE